MMVTQQGAVPERTPQTIFAAGTAATATVQFERPYDGGPLVVRLDLAGFSGTIDIQGRPSPDSDYANVEYVQEQATLDLAVAQLSFTTITANRNYVVPNPQRFMRVVMTRSAGTIEGYADWHSTGAGAGGGGGSETAAVTIADGADTALGAVADAAVSTDTTGTISGKLRGLVKILADVWSDAGNYLSVSLSTLIAGEDITNNRLMTMPSYSFTNITTQTTTVVKSGAGVLSRIVFGKPLALGVVAVYDNTAGSGTLISTITFPAALLSDVEEIDFDCAFATGLTIVTSGATQDITVVYK